MAKRSSRCEDGLRWMIRRDMPQVLAIEQASFDHPWSEQDFIRCLRQRSCIGMVYELDQVVVGYMIYELHKRRLHLVSMAVEPVSRRAGIGRAMIQKLTDKLYMQQRQRITLDIRETNLPGQLFFRSCGFRAVGVLHGLYEEFESDEDAYSMEYRVQERASLELAGKE